MIDLKKEKVKVRIKNPLMNFEIDEQEIEFRRDPLTKRWSRVNINRVKRFKIAEEEKFLEEVVEKSKVNCPFCKENIDKHASKFVEGKERYELGESVIFPNLYPYSTCHAVAVFSTRKHFINLNNFGRKILADTLKNSIRFFKIMNEKNPELVYPSINFNCMPPAAASIVHPHLQLMLTKNPTYFTELQIKNSLKYFERNEKNFWRDLIEIEKKNGERFIGTTKTFVWIANFSPIKNHDISGICLKPISDLTKLKNEEIEDLALGLEKIFSGYWNMGIRSLNMSIFSGSMKEDISDYFLVNVRIISRPFSREHITDAGFMELLHQENVVEVLPEDLPKKIKFN